MYYSDPIQRVKNPAPDPKLKGQRGGNCNRTACQLAPAPYYNPYTHAFYCKTCARELNRVWEGDPIMTKSCYVPAQDERLYVEPPK